MSYEAFHGNDVMVSLTDQEYEEAYARGVEIYRISQSRPLYDNRAFVRNGVNGERVQALGEVAGRAVAKALGVPWTYSLDTFQGPDLPCDIEVRLIGVNHYGLRIYDSDYPSKRVVGIVIPKGSEREPYRIPGWINAIYGKRQEWKRDWLNRGHPVYCVPQEELFPLTALISLIYFSIAIEALTSFEK